MERIIRNYLEIKSLDELLEKTKPHSKYIVEKVSKNDFQLNKYFYKQIGQNQGFVCLVLANPKTCWPNRCCVLFDI